MARQIVFEPQVLVFEQDLDNKFNHVYTGTAFPFIVGVRYTVLWGDTEYTATMTCITVDGVTVQYLGYGESPDGEYPFRIMYPPAVATGGEQFTMFSTTEDGESRTVAVYLEDITIAELENSESLYSGEVIGFTFSETYGGYITGDAAEFTLEAGKRYAVLWNNVVYLCTAQDISALMPDMIAVGNLTAFGYQGNNEPFVIGSNGSEMLFFSTVEIESVAVAVGAIAEVKEEKIILKDFSGTNKEYDMKPMVRLNTTGNGKVIYSKGEVIEDIPISLDFSNGDQTIIAPNGYLVKSAVIAKPENLKPENIPIGINIAGIDGAREEASGGDENATFLYVYSKYQRATGVTSNEFSVQVTLPAGAVVKTAEIRRSFTNMYAGTIPSALSLTSSNCVEPTFEDVDGKIRIRHSAVVTTTSTSYVINLIYLLFVSFELHGYKIRRNSDECTVYLTEDGDISAFSMYYGFADNVTVLDFSACKQAFAITSSQFGYIEYVKKIILPSSVTSIESSALVGCSSLICIDMSNATAVPTLANSYAIPRNAGLEIRVPSALYSQWIAATNWSTLADYIVAV